MHAQKVNYCGQAVCGLPATSGGAIRILDRYRLSCTLFASLIACIYFYEAAICHSYCIRTKTALANRFAKHSRLGFAPRPPKILVQLSAVRTMWLTKTSACSLLRTCYAKTAVFLFVIAKTAVFFPLIPLKNRLFDRVYPSFVFHRRDANAAAA